MQILIGAQPTRDPLVEVMAFSGALLAAAGEEDSLRGSGRRA